MVCVCKLVYGLSFGMCSFLFVKLYIIFEVFVKKKKGDCDECLLCRVGFYIICNIYILGNFLEFVLEFFEVDRW